MPWCEVVNLRTQTIIFIFSGPLQSKASWQIGDSESRLGCRWSSAEVARDSLYPVIHRLMVEFFGATSSGVPGRQWRLKGADARATALPACVVRTHFGS